jgi:hypothetical protein
LGALRRGNHFQQFLRVVHPALKVRVSAEGDGRQLRGHAGVFHSRVGSDEANFVDADSVRSGQGSLELLGKLSGLALAGGKGTGKAVQVFLSDRRKELHAAEARRGKKLRKLLFGGRAFDGHAVEQELRARGGEQ